LSLPLIEPYVNIFDVVDIDTGISQGIKPCSILESNIDHLISHSKTLMQNYVLSSTLTTFEWYKNEFDTLLNRWLGLIDLIQKAAHLRRQLKSTALQINQAIQSTPMTEEITRLLQELKFHYAN
jgi:hypothetical protein